MAGGTRISGHVDRPDLQRLLDYTAWANRRVVRAAATLAPDDFRRDLGASHGGVRGTLTHMLWAEWLWLERFKGVSPGTRIYESEFKDVVALRERWRALERHRESWFAGLTASQAREIVHYRTTEGRPYEAPLWQLVQHVANHASYHRGQVVVLLRQLGARPVSTDLVVWDRERGSRTKQA
jgi:uncharacterized damage-inducible protein DinB